jgi:hypothetical protein
MAGTDETKPESGSELKRYQDAERAGKFLHWRDQATGELRILMLAEDLARVSIGRRAGHHVSLPWDEEVSRTHASLERVGEDWVLIDDSRNGSYINGSRVPGRQLLHNGDRMCVGRTYVGYRDPSTEPPSKTTKRAEGSQGGIQLQGTKRKIVIALCRPVIVGGLSTPATNPQIAGEVHLAVDAVKAHLRAVYEWYGLSELSQNEKRARLVQIVRDEGLIEPWEF